MRVNVLVSTDKVFLILCFNVLCILSFLFYKAYNLCLFVNAFGKNRALKLLLKALYKCYYKFTVFGQGVMYSLLIQTNNTKQEHYNALIQPINQPTLMILEIKYNITTISISKKLSCQRLVGFKTLHGGNSIWKGVR